MRLLDELRACNSSRIDLDEIEALIDRDLFALNPDLALIQAFYDYGKLDLDDYVARYPDIKLANIDPVYHIIKYGIKEKRIISLKNSRNANATSGLNSQKDAARALSAEQRVGCAPALVSGSDMNVSLIIFFYDYSKQILDFLEKLILKTADNVEFVLIEDQLSGNNVDVLYEYANKYSKVRVIHQNNLYAGIEKDVLLKTARGKHLLFLDSDEIFSLAMPVSSAAGKKGDLAR